ncbi:ectoine/hydroxyectoine ABC transporter permease subunit EhuC [Oceanibacterium hippocampi]|uniref:Inner membrane amino-acid ABC transporter permease protein YecS n=1 Tax=Oceanibacterium hippocampi TaxID=745714 RepID=A0A1Y5TEH0_9PROT|nr:ectoine/hydroxyectoine ABC transporter permease subunit EhuC [Oceanibacterium hippocampi]SLN62226.1 Inner membrane amino-acid ABC transporter permease protein YecS [Oceanibacterium hippocampi]
MDQWSGYLQLIVDGAFVTVQLTLMGCALALVMAFVAGLGRLSRFFALRAIATAYIEFFRGTSIFVQLFWAYFVLPLMGVPLSPFQAGVLALGLNVGAYGAEVVRGAIRSIPREQYEACTALNLGRWQRLRHVILPQAFVLMLPTFGNNAIELMKGTAVVSLISLSDMTFQAQVVRAQTGSTAVPFLTILVLYFLFATVLSSSIRGLERRLSRGLEGTRS